MIFAIRLLNFMSNLIKTASSITAERLLFIFFFSYIILQSKSSRKWRLPRSWVITARSRIRRFDGALHTSKSSELQSFWLLWLSRVERPSSGKATDHFRRYYYTISWRSTATGQFNVVEQLVSVYTWTYTRHNLWCRDFCPLLLISTMVMIQDCPL